MATEGFSLEEPDSLSDDVLVFTEEAAEEVAAKAVEEAAEEDERAGVAGGAGGARGAGGPEDGMT